MQRHREFSAQRNQISKSRLNQSRNTPLSSGVNNSKVQKYQIATPVSNKRFSNKSSNLSASRTSQKSTNSEYICTGCFNHELASDRKQERRKQLLRQKQLEKLNTQMSLKQDHEKYIKHSRMVRQFEEMKDYNKKVMGEKERERQKQAEEKNRLVEEQKYEQELFEKKQREKEKIKQEASQRLLKEIKEQIEMKELRKKQQKQRNLKIQVDDVFGVTEQLYYQQRALKEQQYREDLKRQINKRALQLQKEQTEKHNIQNLGIGITEAAYQRQLERQKTIHDRQQALLEQAKKRQKMKEAQMQQQMQKQRALEMQRIKQEQQKQEMQRQSYEAKHNQIQAYLSELEHQIQQQKRQREKQAQQTHKPTNTSIELAQKAVERKSCRSCDKRFPKTFLTKLK